MNALDVRKQLYLPQQYENDALTIAPECHPCFEDHVGSRLPTLHLFARVTRASQLASPATPSVGKGSSAATRIAAVKSATTDVPISVSHASALPGSRSQTN
jgi:hypothetical protein